jgi:hypothetical protein
MNTLQMQKQRLQDEVAVAEERIAEVLQSTRPDAQQLRQLNETIERNRQLMAMIDDHLAANHRPAWRTCNLNP